jgi:enamine deaminase RidA (YjgF/YER057c/UK114 family)
VSGSDGVVDWNEVIGFAPVARRGSLVMVSGAAGIDDEGRLLVGVHAQTVAALRRIEARLRSVGCGLGDVVGTRIYLRDRDDWPDAGRAHGEVMGDLGAALTMVEAALVDPDMAVEIEALAWSQP